MSTLYKDFFNSLYEETLYEINSFRLKKFVESLGFDYKDASQEADTRAVIVKDGITYIFYAENNDATLTIVNSIEHRVIERAYFKFSDGEWNEEEEDKR